MTMGEAHSDMAGSITVAAAISCTAAFYVYGRRLQLHACAARKRRPASVHERLRADAQVSGRFPEPRGTPWGPSGPQGIFLLSFIFSLRWDFCNFR
jgi:hypothetical protein